MIKRLCAGFSKQMLQPRRRDVRQNGDTDREVVLLLEHDLRGHSVVGAVRFVNGKFFLLLFPMRALDYGRKQYAREHNDSSEMSLAIQAANDGSTYVLSEGQAPPLLAPGELRDAFDFDEELSLKVQKLVQTGEKKMEGVAVEDAHGLVTVFLLSVVVSFIDECGHKEACAPA